MECPICYTCDATCKLSCGHSFCNTCIKSWYHKSSNEEATCPMCRGSICFRGFHKLKEQWDEERVLNMYEEVYIELMEEEFERAEEDDEVEFLDEDIEFIQEKFNKLISLKEKGVYFSREEVEELLGDWRYDINVSEINMTTNGDDSAKRATQFLAKLKTYRRLSRGAITKYRTKRIVNGEIYELVIDLLIE